MAGVSVFAGPVDEPVLVLVFICLFLVIFQATQGGFFFAYAAEVCEGAGVAWANFTLFTWILVYSLWTQQLFDALGNGYTFMIFAILNVFGTIMIQLVVKDIKDLSKAEIK